MWPHDIVNMGPSVHNLNSYAISVPKELARRDVAPIYLVIAPVFARQLLSLFAARTVDIALIRRNFTPDPHTIDVSPAFLLPLCGRRECGPNLNHATATRTSSAHDNQRTRNLKKISPSSARKSIFATKQEGS
ncbi:hypothetical protein ACJJTC_006077 [Scirpophaga incertulas]